VIVLLFETEFPLMIEGWTVAALRVSASVSIALLLFDIEFPLLFED
jgi:hypothetical protein